MKLNGKMKKVFALLLCLCMLAQYVPTAVITPAHGAEAENYEFTYTNGTLTIMDAETEALAKLPETDKTPESDKTPDTGNKSKPALYAALAVLSLGALVALIVVQKKTKK